MAETSDETAFNLICATIQEAGSLTVHQKIRLTSIFGSRFTTAYNALQEGKVKKYIFHPGGKIIWIVAGKQRDYQILSLANFCSCLDFYFRVIDHETSFCYHLIAQKLAKALGKYVVIEEADINFTPLMVRWREATSWKRELSGAEVENIRKVVIEILLEAKELPINRLLGEMKEIGFSTLKNRHLANILRADKAKRFKHVDGLWALA